MRPGLFLLPSVTVLVVLTGPASAGPIPIDGRIREPGGAGLPGAAVELRPILSRFEQGLQEADGRVPAPVARAVTAADGRFELAALREGMWEVAVRASGFVPMRYLLTPLLEPASLPAVKLRRDAGLSVRVTKPDGRPLAGARVLSEIVRVWGDSAWPGWEPAPRTATTAKDGSLRLPSTRGELLRLWVAAPGFPVQEAGEKRAPGEIGLRILPGARHDLEVRGPEGRPVEAVVRDLQTSLLLGRTRRGRLTVTGPAQRETWLLVETADGSRARIAVPAHRGPVHAAMPPQAKVPLQVVDAQSRQPIAGGWVWETGDPGHVWRTGEQGAVQLEASRLGPSARLRATASGHALTGRPAASSESLSPLALEPAVSLVGTVVDETGAPAAGVEVRVVVNNFSLTEEAGKQARVSQRGEVRISGLPPGIDYGLIATGAGFASVRVAIKAPEAWENRFRLTVPHGRTVSGEIVDPEGSPIAAADIHLAPLRETIVAVRDAQGFEEEEIRTQSDASGRFAWTDVHAGHYEIFVDRPGFGTLRHGAITVPAGRGTTDLGRLRPGRQPDPQDTSQILNGLVTDPQGKPVAGAEVWAETTDRPYGEWLPYPAAVSGADGTFTVRDLPSSSFVRLDICRTGYVPAKLQRQVFPELLRLTLQPAALVIGRLTAPGGAPLPGRSVNAWNGTSSAAHISHPCVAGTDGSETDEAGWFRLGPLEPGRVVIFPGREPLLLQPGDTQEIAAVEGKPPETGNIDPMFFRSGRTPIAATADLGTLTADPSAAGPETAIEGRILGLPPDELASVRVGADFYSNQSELAAVDEHGAYRLTGVSPGSVELFAQVDDRRVTETVLVPPGESHIARDLVFPPVARVSGSVHGPGGEPVGAAEVQLDYVPEHKFDPARYPFLTSTRSDGSFSLQLPYGRYDVSVRREGYVSQRRDREIFASEGKLYETGLSLERSICLSGRLLGLEPAEIPEIDATQNADSPDHYERLRGTIGPDDRYHICGAGPGTWELEGALQVSSSERRIAKARIDLGFRAADAVLDLDFHIGPLALSGRVRGGEGMKSLWIDLVDAGGHQVVETAPVENGAFRLERLRAGTYRVQATTYDQAVKVLAEQEVQLTSDREVTLDLHP